MNASPDPTRDPGPATPPMPPAGAPGSGEYWLGSPTRSPLLLTLLRLPLKKILIWAAFGLLLYILRDFFPLIFLTFVLSYIGTTIVAKIEHRFTKRWVPVTVFFLLLVGLLVGFGMLTIPRITKQARSLQQQAKEHKGWNKLIDEKLRDALGDERYEQLAEELDIEPDTRPRGPMGHLVGDVASTDSKSLSRGILGKLDKDRDAYIAKVGNAIKALWTGVLYLFMSIIFSYLLVLSLPTFREGAGALERSRLAEAYREVAPSIVQFARLMGRAFEAQTVIAFMNTLITAVGMYVLSIPGIGLLSVGVFVCSFIPVLGVWISTAPVAVVALVMPGGGAGKFLGVLVMVTVAHIVEAYILNPKIYGHHMKMNPLAVLMILVIAEHLVGVWGLVVAVPLMTYVWKHLILGEPEGAGA